MTPWFKNHTCGRWPVPDSLDGRTPKCHSRPNEALFFLFEILIIEIAASPAFVLFLSAAPRTLLVGLAIRESRTLGVAMVLALSRTIVSICPFRHASRIQNQGSQVVESRVFNENDVLALAKRMPNRLFPAAEAVLWPPFSGIAGEREPNRGNCGGMRPKTEVLSRRKTRRLGETSVSRVSGRETRHRSASAGPASRSERRFMAVSQSIIAPKQELAFRFPILITNESPGFGSLMWNSGLFSAVACRIMSFRNMISR